MLGVEGTKCVRGAISIRGVNGTRGATNISGIIATELYIGIELDVTSSIHVIEDITCTNCIHGKGLVGGCIWAIEGTCDLVIKVLSGIHVNTGALVALCIVGGIVINTLGLGVASNGAISGIALGYEGRVVNCTCNVIDGAILYGMIGHSLVSGSLFLAIGYLGEV